MYHHFIIFTRIMQHSTYQIESRPAGDSLITQLYSEQHLNNEIRSELEKSLYHSTSQRQHNKILIVGGKCGLTAEILGTYSTHIDVVEAENYLPILENRLTKGKSIKYRFNRQGLIGEQFTYPPPKVNKCTYRAINLKEWHKYINSSSEYSCIVLQAVILDENINIVHQLMKLGHHTLITMIVPGLIVNEGLFSLLAGIQKNILTVFYENNHHYRLKYVKHITGRREEHDYMEIFIWNKKNTAEENAGKELLEICRILEGEVMKSKIFHETPKIFGNDNYQTPQLVQMYERFHYNDEQQLGIPNFPLTCAIKCISLAKSHQVKGRALDIGCAVGRTTFQLASYFDEVIGLDLSKAFISSANDHLKTTHSSLQKKVQFTVGDACNLDKKLGKFNLIFGGNLIDRVGDPENFLSGVSEFLQEKGILILTSPYTWLQEYTPKQKWLGGYYKEGKEVLTGQGLNTILASKNIHRLQPSENIRFVISENDWVYQYTLAQMTFWRKN